MEAIQNTPSITLFDFDYYRFNGRGKKPSLVTTVDLANFMRSRYSVEEPLIHVAANRVAAWSRERGIGTTPRKPFPSNAPGKYWLEFRIGGLSL